MQRKRKKTKSKENQNLLREKKKSMKNESRNFFSCHIFQHFDKRKVFST
jgi:hypothetical protein